MLRAFFMPGDFVKYIALALLMLAVSAQGATNLAVTCTGAPSGNTCRPHVYALPTAATWVLSGSTWKQFGSLAPSDPVQVCATDVAPGSPSSERDGSPCRDWPFLTASQVSVPVAPGKNTLELKWDAPTKNCQGGPLAPGDLLGYRIAWGTLLNQSQVVDIGLVTSYTLTGLPAGSITATVESRGPDSSTCGKAGPISANTKAPASTDAPPTNLRVADLTVYEIVKARNKLTLNAVGAVPALTACTASVAAPAGFAIVDVTRVAWKAGLASKPSVVVARCN